MSEMVSPLAEQPLLHKLPAALTPGSLVVVRAEQARLWLARVLDPTAVEPSTTTTVEIVDPLGVPGLRAGQHLAVDTDSLTCATAELTDALIDSAHLRLAEGLGAATAAEAVAAIEPLLRELVTSVARYAHDSAYAQGLEHAVRAVLNRRHRAEASEHAAWTWPAAWSEIVGTLDILRCSDCNETGTLPADDTGRDRACEHPHLECCTTRESFARTEPHCVYPALRVLDGEGQRPAQREGPVFTARPRPPDGGVA